MRAMERRGRQLRWGWAAALMPALLAWPCPAPAQMYGPDSGLVQNDLSGPRVGVTYRPDGDTGELGRMVTQFGWHMETQVTSQRGPQFIVEFVPLVAGVQSGRFLPSASLGLGVRLPEGFEFGVGPTVAVGRSHNGYGASYGLNTAVFGAVGQTFDFGGVRVPVNLVVAGNRDGARLTLLTGYAIRRASRPLP